MCVSVYGISVKSLLALRVGFSRGVTITWAQLNWEGAVGLEALSAGNFAGVGPGEGV